MKKLEKITPQKENFAQWYIDVVKQGGLISYGPVKGTIIFKPNSFGIWENIQKIFDKKIKEYGVQNVYLPLLIPMSYIDMEKEHVEGFAPELATITKIGEKKLEEDVVIRPTSEVLFGKLFAETVDSYKQLPIKYNQWANVVRWEKKTNPFLRTSEFLWQEGHTIHSTEKEAKELTLNMIKTYSDFLEEYLAIPVITGRKTEKEKFAGAVETYTIEAMMKDGKALQSGTSHYLGQNFAKSFGIEFKNKENKKELVYQTSWGISTRLIGAIIMTHGDDRGIIIPPKVAPIQIDVIEIFGDKNPKVVEVSNNIAKSLNKDFRIRIDNSNKSPGFKAANSEIQGVPIRVEIGPRDLENNQVSIIRRDTLDKKMVSIDEVRSTIDILIDEIHNNLLSQAKQRLTKNIEQASSYDDEFKRLIKEHKFVLVPFCGSNEDEEQIQKETLASTRCIPTSIKVPEIETKCFFTGKPTKRYVIFSKAY